MALSYTISQATIIFHLTELFVSLNQTKTKKKIATEHQEKESGGNKEFQKSSKISEGDQIMSIEKKLEFLNQQSLKDDDDDSYMLQVQCKILNKTSANPTARLLCAEKIWCSAQDVRLNSITCMRSGQLLSQMNCVQVQTTSMGDQLFFVYKCSQSQKNEQQNWWIGVTLVCLVLVIVCGIACHIIKFSQRHNRKRSTINSHRVSYGSVRSRNSASSKRVRNTSVICSPDESTIIRQNVNV